MSRNTAKMERLNFIRELLYKFEDPLRIQRSTKAIWNERLNDETIQQKIEKFHIPAKIMNEWRKLLTRLDLIEDDLEEVRY